MVESSFLLHDEQLKQDLCQDWKRKEGGVRRERREEGKSYLNDDKHTIQCDDVVTAVTVTHTSGCDNLLGHVYSSLAVRTTVRTLIVPHSPCHRSWTRLERWC